MPNEHDNKKVRTEIDHIRPQRKCFLYHKGGHLAKYCKSRSVNVIAQVKEPKTSEVCCWRCGEVGHLKETSQRTVDTSISNALETRLATRSVKPEPGKLVHSNHGEGNGERKLDNNMATFKIEFAGNPNSSI